jgi:diguanylate cyclase (GGDEF)-like protein
MVKLARRRADDPEVITSPPTQPGSSALDALLDAAAGILAADSLRETLGRIAEHLRALLPYDDLTLYQVEPDGRSLLPVIAVGSWVEEVMADRHDIDAGVTGWVVRNRRTRNIPNSLHDALVTTVPGTEEEAEAFVCVPLLVHDRVVGTLNVYRVGADVAFTPSEVSLIERFATMAALAYDSARQRDSLREQVATDGLTGLLNHRGAQERVRVEVEQARAAGRPVSVVVVDLDHFKLINDSHGHADGDKALAAAAAALRQSVRDSDAVGRLGGEEFLLVLPGVDGPAAVEAAERARMALAEVRVHGRSLDCSAGVATCPDDAQDAPELLERADAALYAAKHGGRRQTRRYGASLASRPSASDERREIEALLRRPESIGIVFQPLLELATGRIGGYEALARIPGDRSPDQWFGQAHRVGLGAELEAAALVAALSVPGRPHGAFLSLNVSPLALLTPVVARALPADLSDYVIELTEHELFAAEHALDEALDELRGRGARVALDDAGAGYAGLQQLIRVAPDILKLDRSLVHGAHADPSRLALIEALAAFAADTGAAVCGEGIEDLEDLRALARVDATYAQGFALARPAADWPALEPGSAAAASSPVLNGMRVAEGAAAGPGTWARALAELAGDLARLRDRSELAAAGRHAARLLDADDAGLMRLVDGELELLSEHLNEPTGSRWQLHEYPATRALLADGRPGQIVVGDEASDPAEVAELERLGHGAMLMVPVGLGDDEPGLLEVYRRQAQAFTSAEIDRARVVALQFAAVLRRL